MSKKRKTKSDKFAEKHPFITLMTLPVSLPIMVAFDMIEATNKKGPKHLVSCVQCGRQFDANRGYRYNPYDRRYTCTSCVNARRRLQNQRQAEERLRRTGMKQTKSSMVAKIAFGLLLVFFAFRELFLSWLLHIRSALFFFFIGSALIFYGLLPYLKAKGVTVKDILKRKNGFENESADKITFYEPEKGRELRRMREGASQAPKEEDRIETVLKMIPEGNRTVRSETKAELYLNDNALLDELLPQAVEVLFETNQASVSMLQRRLKLCYSRAVQILDQIEKIGIVGPFEGSKPRQILISYEQYLKIYPELQEAISRSQERSITTTPVIDYDEIIRNEENWRREMRGLSPLEDELRKIDFMSGYDFEDYCAELLRNNGYEEVEVTRSSGDHGVDITAVKDELKYAVQCKRQSTDCSNKPVQEVTAGKAFYHCHLGAVMTNRYFTRGAKDLAEVNGILLWDRDTITEMLKTEIP